MLKFRPLVCDENTPKIRPTIAIGMTTQLPHPKNGRNDGIASSSAKNPTMIESTLNMMRDWGRRSRVASPDVLKYPKLMQSAGLILVLASAACHPAPPEQPRNFADPAVTEALYEPLLTDVELRGAAGSDALRPDQQPPVMQIPGDAIVDTAGAMGLGQLAALRVQEAAFTGCSAAIGYSAQWSVRLPEWLALPDGAHLAEAAGSDAKGCALRIVRFGMRGEVTAALDNYVAIAKRGGFAVERGTGTLIARRAGDGAAFRVDATTIAAGTRIDLTSNRGR